MFTDFLGAAFNLVQLSGSSPVYRLEFVDDTESPMDLSGTTFSGTVTACSDGSTYPIGVAMSDAETNILGLSFPSLPLGNYQYEIMATDDNGDSLRLVYGQLLVMQTSLSLGKDDGAFYKRLLVREPGAEAKALQLKWLSSSLAQLSAEEAAKYAEEAKNAGQGVTEEITQAKEAALTEIQTAAQDASQDLTAIADSVEEDTARAEDAADDAQSAAEQSAQTLKDAVEFMEDFNQNVNEAISIRGGIWYIGNLSTGVEAIGTPGQPAKLSSSNTWLIYDNESESYADTGVCAQGKDGADGIDGDTVRRILVNSYDDIPQSGETCNGGYYYYVPVTVTSTVENTDEEGNVTTETVTETYYDVYAWLESDGWTKIGEKNDIATAKVYGLVKLSTNYTLADGGIIGVNSNGQMLVIPASYNYYGSVKPSSQSAPGTYCVGINSNGTLGVNVATLNTFGVVKLGSKFQNKNDVPYYFGIGVTEDDKLCVNTIWSGSLQFRQNDDWLALADQMPWLKQAAAEHPEHYTDKYSLALLTSPQFDQSETTGLELYPATTTLLAGVYLATGLDDDRESAVLTASQSKTIKESLDQNITDTKSELTAKYDAEVSRLDQADADLQTAVANVYTQEQVDALLTTQYNNIIADIKAWVIAQGYDTQASVDAKLTGYVKTTATVTEIQALTTEEFNNLESRDDTTLYLN